MSFLLKKNYIMRQVSSFKNADFDKKLSNLLLQVEMEIRELLTEYGFDGDETPVISGSALCTLEDKKPEIGLEAIKELIKVNSTVIFTHYSN